MGEKLTIGILAHARMSMRGKQHYQRVFYI